MIGPNRLVQLIANSEWEAAIQCVQMKPSYARRWSVAPSLTGSASSEILPIHQACANSQVSVQFIECLLFANPNAIRLRESGTGRVPLHVAIRSRASETVILFLLTRFPESCSIQDVYGRLPIHYACSNNLSLDIIHQLIVTYPQACLAYDNDGWVAIHVACLKTRDMRVIKNLLTCCPESVLMKTNHGTDSIVCAERNVSLDRDVIVAMLQKEIAKFDSMPTFQNMKEAEKDEKTYMLNFKPTYSRGRSLGGSSRKIRSRSVRAVV